MRLFSWGIQQDPLLSLKKIIHSLKGDLYYESSHWQITTTATTNRLAQSDPEDKETGTHHPDMDLNETEIAQHTKEKVDELKQATVLNNLTPSITELHTHLANNTNKYGSHYQKNISQKTSDMVIKLDAYLAQKASDPQNEKEKKRLLNEAIKAREAFYNAFEFSQTKNTTLALIVSAILGVITGFVFGPSVLAGAAIGATTGVSLAAIRKKLLIGDPVDLQPLADKIYKEVGNHFHAEKPEPAPTKCSSSPYDNPYNDRPMQPNTETFHTDFTQEKSNFIDDHQGTEYVFENPDDHEKLKVKEQSLSTFGHR